MTSKEIRNKYLQFFENKGHKIIPSASLVPENDPTILFTTAGMHPLVPYLLGEKHPLGNCLVSCQKCLRTQDIGEVGDNTHLTFFEMLGNWSLGDYFKQESIEMSFEFLTKELKIPLDRLAVSVFAGELENNIPQDDEAAKIWQSLGIKKERIRFLGREDNWWGPAGQTGPCGPDTEIFYWAGSDPVPVEFDSQDNRWVEIWNNVFMQYNKTADGTFEELRQKNVDTGMGLERMAAVLQGKSNVYETDLFAPIIKEIRNLPCFRTDADEGRQILGDKAERIIADHIKASVFILAEKICPSNVERGYILRRLIRRAIRYGKMLKIAGNFTRDIAEIVISLYKDVYSEIIENRKFILTEIAKEEETFNKTIERGIKEIEKIKEKSISGEKAFLLYQSYGFPIEMTEEIAKEKGIEVDLADFENELKKHQELSRTANVGQFKAGLADNKEQTIKYHTVAHLLLAALRNILQKPIEQRGSNITAERIRFDFSFDRKLTDEEIKNIENWINEKIGQGCIVQCQEIPLDEALKSGALASFREKYPEKVKVFSIIEPESGEVFSKEICSGPHIKNTKDLGIFNIIKESSSSAGVRRIKAVLQ